MYRLASRNVFTVKRFVRIRRRSAIFARVNASLCVCVSVSVCFSKHVSEEDKIIFSGMEVRVDQRRGQTLFFSSRLITFFLYNNHYAPVSANKCSLLFSDHATRIIGQVYYSFHFYSIFKWRPAPQRSRQIQITKRKRIKLMRYFFLSFFSIFLALHQRKHRFIVFIFLFLYLNDT